MDYKNIWKKTKKDLKKVLPEHGYEAWIETLSPVGATNNIFILEAPNQFAHDWIINNYQDLILSSLREYEPKIDLRVAIAPQADQNILATSLAESEPIKQSLTTGISLEHNSDHRYKHSSLAIHLYLHWCKKPIKNKHKLVINFFS